MPKVTVGVPVYNGKRHIEECLDNLTSQSFEDIAIVVSDNGSVDGTIEIVERFQAADPRVSLVRQPFNVGILHNYRSLVMQAATPLFVWRAEDDFSDNRFLERLVGALDVCPEAVLAAASVVTYRDATGSGEADWFPEQFWRDTAHPTDLVARLEVANASWFYGLWRTDALQRAYTQLTSRYMFPYAHDPLLVAGAVMDDSVVGVPEAEFTQRTDSRGRKSALAERSFAERIAVREQTWLPFLATFRAMVMERQFNSELERALLAYALAYAKKHVVCTQWQFARWQIRKALSCKKGEGHSLYPKLFI